MVALFSALAQIKRSGRAPISVVWRGLGFSKVTRVVAVVFGLAGVGALFAGVSASYASDGVILACLAAGFIAVGAGAWMEYLWAWWAAIGVSLFTVVMTLALRFPFTSALVWSAVLALLATSAIQGRASNEPRH